MAAHHEEALLDLALLLLCWEERVAGGEEWNYDGMQRLAEEMESRAEDWRVLRPQLAAAMQQLAEAAWTVL